MEKEGFFLQVKEQLEAYVEDRLLLVKLQFTEKAAKISAVLFITIIISFLGLILFMILSFIAGFYLSQLLGSYPVGFGIVAAVYLFIILLLIFIHKKFTGKMISDSFVKFSFGSKETFSNEV